EVPLPELPPLLPGVPPREMAAADFLLRDAVAGDFAQASEVAGLNGVHAAAVELPAQMIGRQDAVAIEEHEVVGGAGGHALVTAAGELKAIVRVRREPHRKRR